MWRVVYKELENFFKFLFKFIIFQIVVLLEKKFN